MTPSTHPLAQQTQVVSRNGRRSPSAHADIPLGIWLCPPDDIRAGQVSADVTAEQGGVLPALVARIITEFAEPGATILTSGAQADSLAQAARSSAHRVIAAPPEIVTVCDERNEQAEASVQQKPITAPGAADLAVAVSESFDSPNGIIAVCRGWAMALSSGGIAVVITNNPAGPSTFANQAGAVVAAARDSGLAYRQHVVAVVARVCGDRLLIPTDAAPQPAAAPSDTVHLPVHTDLLIFQRVAAPSADGGAQ